MNQQIIITKEHSLKGMRLDKAMVVTLPEFTRSHLARRIEQGFILVNDTIVKPSLRLSPGDIIDIETFTQEVGPLIPENIPLDIVYEDEDIIVINKKQGMVVHPSNGHQVGTLVHALLYHCKDLSGINGEIRPGIVHRIDKDTSGLIVVAKSDTAHVALAEQLVDHSLARTYLALVNGVVRENKGKVIAPIGRNLDDRLAMDVIKDGKDATTLFTVLERFEDHSLLSCQLHTGRTHQIRVHMKYIHHPIESDPVYNKQKHRLHDHGQLLHAKGLVLVHPRTKQVMEFDAPLPDYFEEILMKLRR
jgi:23S rRNA pseudouridine1911/1915/1917 synthase